jgi:DNA-binding transcriptional regulator GbsR (MarR family)
MKSKYFTVKDISEITGISKPNVYARIENFGIKPDLIKLARNGRNLNFYLFETVYKFFDISINIPIIKKERKPYFEFASVIVESKINQNGID